MSVIPEDSKAIGEQSTVSLIVLSFAVSLTSLVISVITIVLVAIWVNLSGAQGAGSVNKAVDTKMSASNVSEARQRAIERLGQMRGTGGASGEKVKSISTVTEPIASHIVKQEGDALGIVEAEEKAEEINIVSQKGPSKKVDISQLSDRGNHLDYAGTTIMKLGYGDGGVRKSPRETLEDRANFVKRITSMGDSFAFHYPAIGEEKARVVVFTDPTCPFCQRLHGDIEHIQNAGVSVHYIMFPRRMPHGYDDPGVQQVLSAFEYAWCSSDPNSALDEIYHRGINGYSATECAAEEQGRTEFPYAEHYLMVKLANVTATPISFTEDGRQIVGYSSLSNYLNEIGVR